MRLIERILLGILAGIPAFASATDRVAVVEGRFVPLYGPGGSKLPVTVPAFSVDRVPVTRDRFAVFLEANPRWKKGVVSRTFADAGYLADWSRDRFPSDTGRYPVVFVSYFAASAYCDWKGGRLPSVVEWEYIASAGKKSADGTKDPEQVSEWIQSLSGSGAKPVGKSVPNFHGIQDLYGMVWEWTQDYNSSFVTADNREDGEVMKNFFCGSASTGAADRANYPAFMRYAMRSGLRPNYTIANLGFRCAYDLR